MKKETLALLAKYDQTHLLAFYDQRDDVQKENFLDKIYRGVATRKDITRYTRKIDTDIAKIYGW